MVVHSEVVISSSMTGGGSTSGNDACTGFPSATLEKTLLTVSSVRVEGMWSFLVARITVEASRKRLAIFVAASNTSVDRKRFLDSGRYKRWRLEIQPRCLRYLPASAPEFLLSLDGRCGGVDEVPVTGRRKGQSLVLRAYSARTDPPNSAGKSPRG